MFKSAFVMTLAAVAMVSASLSVVEADQQGYPSTVGEFTNVPAFFTNATATLTGGNTLVLHANSGLGYQVNFQGSNLVSGPLTTWFYPTVDGTNYFNSPWATLSVGANGTNTVTGGTNWSQLQLRGFAGMSVVVSNGTGNGVWFNSTLTNATATATNYVNGGAVWNRPNQ